MNNSKFINKHQNNNQNPSPLSWYKKNRSISSLTKEEFQNKFKYTKTIAKKSLQCNEYQMKLLYQKFNINKWPYRRVQSIENRLKFLYEKIENSKDEEELLLLPCILNEIDKLLLLERMIKENPSLENYKELLDNVKYLK